MCSSGAPEGGFPKFSPGVQPRATWHDYTSRFMNGRGGSQTRPYRGQGQGASPSAPKGPGGHSAPHRCAFCSVGQFIGLQLCFALILPWRTVFGGWPAGEALFRHGARTWTPRRSAAPSTVQARPNFVGQSGATSRHPQSECVFGIGLLIPPRENCFVSEAGGRSPPASLTKLFLCTGRERRHPAKVRPRPPPIRTFSRQRGI